jgi:transcriptional regulator with XRE-family HTH domain
MLAADILSGPPPSGRTGGRRPLDTILSMTDALNAHRWETFSWLIRERRGRLGYSQREVYNRGGPSPVTLVQLENPEHEAPRPSQKTLARIDHALQWSSGTAGKVLDGLLDPEDALAARVARPDDTDAAIEQSLDPGRIILDYGGELISYIMAVSEVPEIDEGVRRHGQELNNILADFYITALLEQNGGPGKPLSDPLRASILPALTAPEPVKGTQEHHRWAYRRWLAGLQCDAEDAERFARYWESRS